MGVRDESGEFLIGTDKGVIKVRTIRRNIESERWNNELFNRIKCASWDPVPGEGNGESVVCVLNMCSHSFKLGLYWSSQAKQDSSHYGKYLEVINHTPKKAGKLCIAGSIF